LFQCDAVIFQLFSAPFPLRRSNLKLILLANGDIDPKYNKTQYQHAMNKEAVIEQCFGSLVALICISQRGGVLRKSLWSRFW